MTQRAVSSTKPCMITLWTRVGLARSSLSNRSHYWAIAAAVVVLTAASPNVLGSNAALSNQSIDAAPAWAFEQFLDRLMAAESGGRTHARNPRSSALGPFQFIKSTFLEVVHRHFASEIVGLSEGQILDRRTDPVFSRRAAAAFCTEIASYLRSRDLEPTFAHLRLAYLLGPRNAALVLRAQPLERLVDLLSSTVIRANPFMGGMRVGVCSPAADGILRE